eukprot:scaffold110582_cov34-Prasinocladus_malaysianus.AAC.1
MKRYPEAKEVLQFGVMDRILATSQDHKNTTLLTQSRKVALRQWLCSSHRLTATNVHSKGVSMCQCIRCREASCLAQSASETMIKIAPPDSSRPPGVFLFIYFVVFVTRKRKQTNHYSTQGMCMSTKSQVGAIRGLAEMEDQQLEEVRRASSKLRSCTVPPPSGLMTALGDSDIARLAEMRANKQTGDGVLADEGDGNDTDDDFVSLKSRVSTKTLDPAVNMELERMANGILKAVAFTS